MSRRLLVTVIPSNTEDSQVEFDADFLSFVNHNTFGKPALIAPGADGREGATTIDKGVVVYVNPNNVSVVQVEKR